MTAIFALFSRYIIYTSRNTKEPPAPSVKNEERGGEPTRLDIGWENRSDYRNCYLKLSRLLPERLFAHTFNKVQFLKKKKRQIGSFQSRIER